MTDPVDIVARLRTLIKDYPHDQAQLAAEWRERWNGDVNPKEKERKVAESTVPSRLSSLRNGKPDGLGFFFKDRRRARLLLEILGVPESEQAELCEAAEAALAGRSPARLLVLFALEPGLHDPGLWTRLRRWLELPETPRPAVLCVNDAQWDMVPRSLDEVEGVTVEKTDADTARARATEVADQGGLVASARWGVAPFEQWLAVDFGAPGDALQCAPEGWRGRWRGEGRLEPLPDPAHRLDALDFEADDEEPVELVGPALRQYLIGIVTGDEQVEPEVRLAHAHALGVTAGASEAEVQAFQGRELDWQLSEAARTAGSPAEVIDGEALQQLLARARVRRLSAVRKVGDRWHWINVEPPADRVDHPRVEVHQIEAPAPALDRLWAHIQTWTVDDLARDPMLHAAVDQLGLHSVAEAADFARAWIRVGDWQSWPRAATKAAHEPPPDLEEALQRLISSPAVEAELRLRVLDESHWTTAEELSRWQDANIGVFREPPRGPVRVRRTESVVVLGERPEAATGDRELLPVDFVPEDRVLGPEALDPFCDRLLALLDSETERRWHAAFRNEAAWLELVNKCSRPSGYYRYGQMRREWDHYSLRNHSHLVAQFNHIWRDLPSPDETIDWFKGLPILRTRSTPRPTRGVPIPEIVWTRADLFVAQLRRALRLCLATNACATLTGSTLLLPLRSGVDARVELHAATAAEPAAVVELPVDQSTHALTWSAYLRAPEASAAGNEPWSDLDRQPPLDLPLAITLSGAGVVARITFVPDLVGIGLSDDTLARIESQFAETRESIEGRIDALQETVQNIRRYM